MHVVIINGSPRTKKFSNTDKIIQSFAKGLQSEGSTCEVYSLSNRSEWEAAWAAFMTHDKIIIALPLYVECAPSLLLEFLSTLPTERRKPATLSFILQSGFAEGCQLRCGEAFLKSLPAQLGCTFGGCLLRGNNFGIRIAKEGERNKILKPYADMGRSFAQKGNFLSPEAARFVGLETFPLVLRKFIMLSYKVVGHRKFSRTATEWGCTRPLDDRPY